MSRVDIVRSRARVHVRVRTCTDNVYGRMAKVDESDHVRTYYAHAR